MSSHGSPRGTTHAVCGAHCMTFFILGLAARPFFEAAKAGDVGTMRALLDAGQDVDAADPDEAQVSLQPETLAEGAAELRVARAHNLFGLFLGE